MDSDDLTPEQAKRLHEIVTRQLRFLNKLCLRLDQVHFDPTDLLYHHAFKARDAVHGLSVITHFPSRRGSPKPPARP